MLALKDCFICRNNASKKTNHQEISKSTEAKGTICGRKFFPNGRKTTGIYSKTGTRHQDIHQEGFHSAYGLWRHRGEHRDQGSIPALGRNFPEDQAGRISQVYSAQRP
jgi:hypothetical protein